MPIVTTELSKSTDKQIHLNLYKLILVFRYFRYCDCIQV